MNFGEALAILKQGGQISRRGWNGRNMWLTLITVWEPMKAEESHPRAIQRFLPFIAMRTAQSDMVPWLASQTDILADDWEHIG